MPVTLENLTDRPVLLTLGGGEALRLSPGETSEPLDDVELEAVGKIGKLVERGVVRVHEPKKAEGKKSGRSGRSRAGDDAAEQADETPA
jgi:hypothetical protein